MYFGKIIGRVPPDRAGLAAEVLRTYDIAVREGRSVDPSSMALAAAALGTMARMASPAESLSQRYGSRSKRILGELRALRPEAAWPKILEGVWHYEVVRRGGAVGAALLQASVERGDQLLKGSAEQMPTSPAAPFAHAVAMWSLDPVGLRVSARLQIDSAIKLSASGVDASALVEAIKIHAMTLKALDESGDLFALKQKALAIM